MIDVVVLFFLYGLLVMPYRDALGVQGGANRG